MSKPELILIGAGGHTEACIDIIEQAGHFRIAGLVGRPDELSDTRLGYSVIATDSDLQALARSYRYALITLGQIETPAVRMRLYEEMHQLGFVFPAIVAVDAYVSAHAIVGAGTIVMHGAVVNAGATVGENCILNTNSLVEHGAKVGNHTHISTGAILNGDVSVGAGSFLGSGSLVKQGVCIGENCVVGMGACVRHHLADRAQFVG